MPTAWEVPPKERSSTVLQVSKASGSKHPTTFGSHAHDRLVSLDAFRGAAIAAMILVNNPGKWSKVYGPLKHAQWNGWTLADCVFPFFLFIVGVAIVFSLGKRKGSADPGGNTLLRILRRTCILFGLGLLLNGFPDYDLSSLRIPGVLQRIAVCYLIASIIVLETRIITQACMAAGTLISYWLMLEFIPVPGIGPGSLEPGTNLAAYVDGLLLPGHLWYNIRPFDPEGILSTIPALGTTLLGVLTGHWLRSLNTTEEKVVGMLAGGILLLIVGQVLNIWLPINKGIWTSSFAVFMTAMALIILAVFCWLIDVKGYKEPATPFVIFGMNAIAAYVISELLSKTIRTIKVTLADGTRTRLRTYIFDNFFAPLADGKSASLIFAAAFVFLMFLVVWAMWKKRWFLKV
jgi:predicted acyltransferase